MDAGAVANSTGTAIDFRVLGPIEASCDRRLLPLGGRQQRMLLALLLLEPGQPISVDRLMEELWHGDPPSGAGKTVRVYVSRLRSALASDAVVARPPGYVLEVEADRIDAIRFERLLHQGREALGRGAAGLAADRLGAALALWRGPAFSDVADAGTLALEAQRLDELRLVCREEQIEAQLALGRHAELAAELERLVAEQPLRERLWRQLVIALYRSERQADALAAYRRARAHLSEELGLEPSEELRALERAVLRQEVAAASPAYARHNLPAPVTSFVGRGRELADLERLLREQRLVTLTGMGGAGKTRVALEAASRQVGVWPGGVWLVDLMPLSDPALVPTAVARTLGVAEPPDIPVLDALVDQLSRMEVLLVLDNCERVAAACAALVHEVLSACADVRVLATSRVGLGIAGELDYALEPLAIPTESASAEEVEQFACVRLFLERGRAARRDLTAEGEELRTVGRICRELDGLPLAIELAAARAKVLSLDEIAAHLDDRLRFLRSWRRIADPRHQTLRTAIDGSYELLTEEERSLLAGLSVFAGGFTLDAVAAVCLGGDDDGALEGVGRLVESSLVVADDRDGRSRYRLLETIREYAAERLASGGAAEEFRRSHAEHFLELANQARPDFIRFSWEKQREGLALLDSERDNLHAAMQWALDAATDIALPLACALRTYWNIRGYRRQGLEWLEQALALPQRNTPPRVRAEAAAAAALLARLAGDFARAQRLAEEAIAVGRRADLPMAVATGLNVLVTLAGRAGDFDRARVLCEQSVAVAREAGSPRVEALAFFILAEAALHAGRHSEAREAGARALELARTMEDHEVMSLALGRLGMVAAHEGRLEDARDQLLEALEYVRALGFNETGAWCCDGLGLVAAAWGDSVRAVRLLGAADALRRAGGGILQPAEAVARASALAAVRDTLGEDEIEAELERGGGLSPDETIEEARGMAAPAAPGPTSRGSGATASV
jgi:predicted ATPase/DNA-binding SARP family transcriptional activator